VVLEVEDTGPGVKPADEARLFEPFFTTKPVGQGTGLGLSISYGIIESFGGKIGYRRGPASGGIFYFELPAAAE
jgi:signal transduction histidine kinase